MRVSVSVKCAHFIIGHNSTGFNVNSSDIICQGNCSLAGSAQELHLHASVVPPVAVVLCIKVNQVNFTEVTSKNHHT